MDNAEELKLQWRDGEPPKPYREEWFIARLTENGGRVVLRALPEDFTYDYKTADETYYMASRIKSWMQFPDSNYIAPKAVESEQARDAGRLYIDTEFNEFRGELISIALVGEDGREFYEVLPPPAAGYGPWVAQHVVPILNKPPISKQELQAKLHIFMSQYRRAHIIADWPEDIEHFLSLLITGPGMRVGPDRWTMEVRRDLPNTADVSAIPHNALEDARALARAAMSASGAPAAAPAGKAQS